MLGGDYAPVSVMRADIARHRARLNDDIRCGREAAAARHAADLDRIEDSVTQQLIEVPYREVLRRSRSLRVSRFQTSI